MARVPIHTRESSQDAAHRPLFDALDALGLQKFAHQIGALANHPALAGAFLGLLRAYYESSTVPRRYLELAILLVSTRNRCGYCVVHHAPPAVEAGISAAQLAVIDDGTWAESDLFDEAELAVLNYTDQLSANSGRVNDSLVERLRLHFDDQQLVELTVRAAMCEFFNRFNEAMQLDVEPLAEALHTAAIGARPKATAAAAQPARTPRVARGED